MLTCSMAVECCWLSVLEGFEAGLFWLDVCIPLSRIGEVDLYLMLIWSFCERGQMMLSDVGVRILVKDFLRRPPVYRIELVTTLEGRGRGVQIHWLRAALDLNYKSTMLCSFLLCIRSRYDGEMILNILSLQKLRKVNSRL